jgi:hypothetical protein
LAERERDHQEIDAAGADGEQAEDRRERRAEQMPISSTSQKSQPSPI